jgi:chitodextrinase
MKRTIYVALPLLITGMLAYPKKSLSNENKLINQKELNIFDPCSEASAWVSATVYTTGNYVKYNGRLWRAKHWTQGDTPRGFGVDPYGPWEDMGPCI